MGGWGQLCLRSQCYIPLHTGSTLPLFTINPQPTETVLICFLLAPRPNLIICVYRSAMFVWRAAVLCRQLYQTSKPLAELEKKTQW